MHNPLGMYAHLFRVDLGAGLSFVMDLGFVIFNG